MVAQSTPAAAAKAPAYQLVVDSAASNRTVALEGAEVKGYTRVELTPARNVKKVDFYVDDTGRKGGADKTDKSSPFRLGFRKADLPDGAHTITAVVTMSNGTTTTVESGFTVRNNSAPAPTEPEPRVTNILHDGAVLDGRNVTVGDLAVELATDLTVDGVRFRVDGNDGPFVRPADGVIATTLQIAGDGTHVVTAELFRDRKAIETVEATVTTGEVTEPLPQPQPAASAILRDGTPLDGANIDAGDLAIELQTAEQVDGVRFRVDGNEGPFVRPADGVIASTLQIAGDGTHVVTAELFRDRKAIETVEATVTIGAVVEPRPEPQPDPEPEAPQPASSTLVSAGAPLDGAKVDAGDLDVEVATEITVDGVRFRVNGNDGVFTRPADGRIATTLRLEAEGTHVVSAEIFQNRETVEKVQATVTVDAAAAPAPAPAPKPGVSGKRLGLHVTEGELAIWRQRATKGPYKAKGDESSNSPGDWDRIVANARGFKNNVNASFWNGAVANNPGGCLQPDGGKGSDSRWSPPMEPADRVRDAAFYALVADDAAYASAVKSMVLKQADVKELDFSNRKRYCPGVVLDVGPSFEFATWLTKLLFAVDYLEARDPNAFTSSERAKLDRWFAAAAEWMKNDVDSKLDQLFVNRDANDFRLTSRGSGSSNGDRITYLGGPEAKTLHRRFNNRGARMVRFVALVGIDQNDAALIKHGKDYVEDGLRFGYFPEGATGDFERWSSSMPIKGWKYANEWTGALVSIADHLSRAGDNSLYEFQTTDGALGTEGRHHSGKPKSLHTLITDLYGYVDGTFDRYGTNQSSQRTAAYRIDSVDEKSNDHRVSDTMLVMANRYYQDDYIRSIYTRKAKGAPGYPQKPGSGMGEPWSGEHGVYPAMLFMFGQTEGLAG